ncbi:MAG: hypothetical protein B6247_06585 [Candidatus Parabeggiatoa sp. nov. 2]|nr:MAG: hypothetical protein B6247_06585 [Beggiatoa sp. 4572_84]
MPENLNFLEFVHCDKLAKKSFFITILGRLGARKNVIIEIKKFPMLYVLNELFPTRGLMLIVMRISRPNGTYLSSGV